MARTNAGHQVSVALAARKKIASISTRAIQLVYDNYNALAIGYGPNERASDAIFCLASSRAG